MQRNLSLYLHIHCRAINIFISHDLLPSDLVAQSVEQRWSNPKVVGSIPTLVRVFLPSLCGPNSICRANTDKQLTTVRQQFWVANLHSLENVR